MKKMLLVSILLIPLMLITTQIAYAGEGPKPGESVVGPTMDGVVWLTLSSSGIDGVFLGNCNGKPFVIDGNVPGIIGTVTAETLVHLRIPQAGPPGCRTMSGGENLIITAVKNFSNDGTQVLADVDLKFVIPK